MPRLSVFAVMALATSLAACSNDLTGPSITRVPESVIPSNESVAPETDLVASAPLDAVPVTTVNVDAASGPAFALNTSYGIPAHSGGSGSAKMTTFSSSFAAGQIVLKNSGYNCVYVQKAPFAVAAADGSWKRATTDVCSPTSGIRFNWSDNFWLVYKGFKSRICRKRALYPDSCGDEVHIYR